jgi:ribosome biogenesis GTPase
MECLRVTSIDLSAIGFSDRERALFASLEEEGFVPGRVARVDRGMPLVLTEQGSLRAEPAMHLVRTRGEATSRAVVGDWVALNLPAGHDHPIIEAILPRSSAFVRQDPGEATEEQVVAANVDTVFVMQSVSGRGVNLRRLERELVLAWESGAKPIVVLTKADLAADADEQLAEARSVSAGASVLLTSSITGQGLADLSEFTAKGMTVALLGASGVGKSTLINRLIGQDVRATAEVRAFDSKGRHTTVARELVMLPGGGVVIDTPGMRAIALWDAEDGIGAAFPEIDELAERCRFADCRHETEPGCAVIEAVESGQVPARRLESYLHLRRELDSLAARQDERARREKERKDGKAMSRAIKSYKKHSEKGRGRD